MKELGFKIFVVLMNILAYLPLRWIWMLGNGLGQLVWLANGRARRTTEINIGLCFPQKTPEQRQLLAQRSMRESSKLAAEFGFVWLREAEFTLSHIKHCQGAELLDQAVAAGNGVIVLAPHIGNWEVLGLYLAKRFQITCLYQPPKSKVLDELILAARSRNGAKIVPTNRKGVGALLKALKSGEVVGILPDQEPELSGGVFAPFFGVSALSMTLISNLVRKTGATVICAYGKRLAQSPHFELVFRPADPAIVSADIIESVSALNRSVEACVLDAPEQYQWEYKRFKKRPNNEARIYPKN